MCDGGEKPTYSLSGIIDCIPTSTTIIVITYLKFRNGGNYHAFGNTVFCYSLYLMFRNVGMTYFIWGSTFPIPYWQTLQQGMPITTVVPDIRGHAFFVTTCVIFRNVFNQLLGTDRQYISSVQRPNSSFCEHVPVQLKSGRITEGLYLPLAPKPLVSHLRYVRTPPKYYKYDPKTCTLGQLPPFPRHPKQYHNTCVVGLLLPASRVIDASVASLPTAVSKWCFPSPESWGASGPTETFVSG